jgi:ankyrin repeat protein
MPGIYRLSHEHVFLAFKKSICAGDLFSFSNLMLRLHSHRAVLNSPPENEATLLQYTAKHMQADEDDQRTKMLSALLYNGANPSVMSKQLDSALYYVAGNSNPAAPDLIVKLIDSGAYLGHISPLHGSQAVHHAAAMGLDYNLLAMIDVDHSCVTAVTEDSKISPLHLAAINGHASTAALLLAHNAHVTKDAQGLTPTDYTTRFCPKDKKELVFSVLGSYYPRAPGLGVD